METILIVEDNPDLLNVLEQLLGDDYDVHTARRGEEAIEQAKRHEPELVILDIMLPSMDGIEAGQWIKRDLEDQNIQILALTALAGAGDPEAVLESGCCDDYMAKPASLDDIQAKVTKLLAERRRAA